MNELIHNEFKINGVAYSEEELLDWAQKASNDGTAYQKTIGNFILQWLDASDVVFLQTSGSTGVPKKIEVKKSAMVQSAKATGAFFDLKAGNTALNCLPIQYVAGKMMLVRALVLGLEIDLVEASSHPLENNPKKYDFVAMTPMQAHNSLAAIKNCRTLLIGGAKINATLEENLLQIPTNIYETYGMTETVSHVALRKVGEKVFTILPHVQISQDDRKCLIINAPKLSDNAIITNDLVEIISETQFTLLGRFDNIINSGGIKLIPEQIENKIVNHIKQRFFIMGSPDVLLGEKVVLVVEGAPMQIDRAIFESLEKYEKPKEIIFMEKLHETSNGKIIRKL
jgi:o-succinylbenzoate---CoA ligase